MESSNSVTNAAYEKMQVMDTDSLLRIWREGEQSEYSVVEQEAARKVLIERLGGAPAAAGTSVVVKDVADEDDDDAIEVTGPTRWLSFISSLAGFLSWLLLALFVSLAGLSAWQNIQNSQMGMPVSQLLLSLLTSSIYTLLLGGFYFTVLQFVSRGLSILQDIAEYTGYLVDRKG